MQWCRDEVKERLPLLRALDQLDPKLGHPLINELSAVMNAGQNPQPGLAIAYGRLLARLRNAKECKAAFKAIHDGELWHEAVRTFVRGMIHFQKSSACSKKL